MEVRKDPYSDKGIRRFLMPTSGEFMCLFYLILGSLRRLLSENEQALELNGLGIKFYLKNLKPWNLSTICKIEISLSHRKIGRNKGIHAGKLLSIISSKHSKSELYFSIAVAISIFSVTLESSGEVGKSHCPSCTPSQLNQGLCGWDWAWILVFTKSIFAGVTCSPDSYGSQVLNLRPAVLSTSLLSWGWIKSGKNPFRLMTYMYVAVLSDQICSPVGLRDGLG